MTDRPRGISLRARTIAAAARRSGAVLAVACWASACAHPSRTAPSPVLAPLGGVVEDRARVMQLTSHATTDGTLLRTPSTALGTSAAAGFHVLLPSATLVYNDAIAYGPNLGNLWAGRGTNVLASAGAAYESRYVRVVVAPEAAHSDNRVFEVLPGLVRGRSAFSSPWHAGVASADLPLRFGTAPITLVSPGQSSLTVRAGAVAVGVSSEEQWWGPGIRNALLLSNNAGSVPHAFVRTSRPLRTPLGAVEARWIVGALTESTFFDSIPSNDTRSLGALAVTLRPSIAPNVTLGLAHSVLRAAARGRVPASALFDPLTRWRAGVQLDTAARPFSAQPDTTRDADDLVGLWARWVFPNDGLEIYGETVRAGVPRQLREWLVVPQAGFGYTIGLQWAGTARASGRLRWQAEVSSVEQTADFAGRALADLYTGAATPQGFTQRGRVLGAATGPGSSSQFVGADWLATGWQAGLTATRVRWENDAMYRQPAPNFFRHDVSLLFGVRGGLLLPHATVLASFEAGRRDNYLFQNGFNNPGGFRTIDVPMTTARITVTSR